MPERRLSIGRLLYWYCYLNVRQCIKWALMKLHCELEDLVFSEQ